MDSEATPPWRQSQGTGKSHGGAKALSCRNWNRDVQARILLQLHKTSAILNIPLGLSEPRFPVFKVGLV